jgi:peptidyl-prolyl cis-trans isomerase D
MMKFLRSQSQTVLIVILAVIGLGFLFYGNSGSFLTTGGGSPTDFGRIDGQDISVAQLYGAVHNVRNLLALQGKDQQVTQAQIAEQAWDDLVSLHEADKLHIDVPDSALISVIQSLPQFQKDGVYSPDLYRAGMIQFQNALHLSPDIFTGMIHTEMRIDAVRQALTSSVHAVAFDTKSEYEREYGPVQLSYVSFPIAAYASSAKITPEQIEADYKANPTDPANRTEEKRQVEYVMFPLSADQQKLPDKDKAAAIQALGEKALDFALALQPDPNATGTAPPPVADFDAEAKKRGLTPVTTNPFSATTPPAGMPPSPAFNNAAFALSKEDPISKVVQLDNGVAVLRLVQIQPSELRPLAEVTPAIEKKLQAQQGETERSVASTIADSVLQAEVKKGVDFKTAAAAQHLAVQTMPPFVPRNASMSDIKQATLGYYSAKLPVGGLSEPIPLQDDDSVVILHVDSRAAADPAGFNAFETQYGQARDQELRGRAFVDWINWQSKQPGTHRPPNLEIYGGVE